MIRNLIKDAVERQMKRYMKKDPEESQAWELLSFWMKWTTLPAHRCVHQPRHSLNAIVHITDSVRDWLSCYNKKT